MTLKPLTPNGGYKAFRKIEIEGKGANALCKASERVNSGLLEHLSSSCRHWGQLRLLPDPCLLIKLKSDALKGEMDGVPTWEMGDWNFKASLELSGSYKGLDMLIS